MFSNNKNFYPTPDKIVGKMISRIKGYPRLILEPSAGKGNITDALKKRYESRHSNGPEIMAIEIEPELQACLRGKGVKLLDSDFLAYTGPDKFDLILANPPYDNGHKHLLKMLDIMYRGQIICLLNAETIRNPYTNERKLLVQRLDELGAYIEFIPHAFQDAERQTDVEVALIDIFIDRKVEDDLFAGVKDWKSDADDTFTEKHEVSTGRSVEELVLEYNETIQAGTDTIISYYKNYRKVGQFLKLNDHDNKLRTYNAKDLTEMMQQDLNGLLKSVRISFWRRTLDLQEVRSRLTKKKQEEFEEGMKSHANMDFTEGNIRQFVLNLIGGYEKNVTEAILDVFDRFTVRHCYERGIHEKNVHLFSGWKTNKAFKVGKRVVIPVYGSYGGAFFDSIWNSWKLNYAAAETLRDIDVVMNSLDGGRPYVSISKALEEAFAKGITSGIDSTYFKITAYKKNTVHLTFKDEDILRRFNVVACRGKGWLPGSFGSASYDALNPEEKVVVDSFEGKETYEKFVNAPLFGEAPASMLGLPMTTQQTLFEADDFRLAA